MLASVLTRRPCRFADLRYPQALERIWLAFPPILDALTLGPERMVAFITGSHAKRKEEADWPRQPLSEACRKWSSLEKTSAGISLL
jgi:hypothetical protein